MPFLLPFCLYFQRTCPGTKTRYLLLRYETGTTGNNADSMITALHVFDGGTIIFIDDSVELTGGPGYTIIDMGSDKTISWAFRPSINVEAGVKSLSHCMRIYTVMAEWH